MTPVILTTYDTVPPIARGYVRDIRVRWILGETGRAFRVETTPLHPKAAAHLEHQPFGQVPFIRDGNLVLFESGAIVLHLARDTPFLPEGDDGARVLQWVIAALNSVEPFALNWLGAKFFARNEDAAREAEKALGGRLDRLEDALAGREWLVAGQFTAADLMLADILRLLADNGLLATRPGLAAYVARATARPAFIRAREDQLAHFRAEAPA